ncbi:MAG: hypothetical protein H6577_18375 [Lewinellaceae bacterium]|nr:hypothetical protein [Saprospiraceae bacterium]MCB9340093.1 hypothetical protein [Lewinellaceae bacterium]
MMIPVVTTPALRSYVIALTVALCAFTFSSNAQPAPFITGDSVVCPNVSRFYATDFQQGHSWAWSVSPGGTITQNLGNFIEVKWANQQNTTQWVLVAETDQQGNMAEDTLVVLIKSTVLSCENSVNVSLDQSGLAVITPNVLLDGYYNTYQGFTVTITTQAGVYLGNTIDCSQIGKTLIGKVTVDCTGNSCWSNLHVEDKKAPLFNCPADPIEIPCNTDLDNYPHPPVADNCDPNPFIALSGFQVDNTDVCNGVTITQTWTATDNFDNQSSCVQVLHISPDSSLHFPEDRIWECTQYTLFPNITDPTPYDGILATTGSGIPDGATGPYCPFSYLHIDDTLAACGNTFKIIRTWSALNWCTGQIILTDSDGNDNEQIIKILDVKKPTMTVPPITLSANITGTLAVNCASTGLLPAPTFADDCSQVTIRIFTPIGEAIYVNGVDGKQGGYVPSPGLTIGNHTILYKAIDDCGNVNEIPVNAAVVDDVIPTVICDEITDVNLDIQGYADIMATTFDDGSHDNCCLDKMWAKRMGDPDSYFGPTVSFSCDDDEVMVVLRVFDCFGNYNECMVTAVVNDKIAPTCIAPPQKTIACTNLPPDITDAWLQTQGIPNYYDNCNAVVTELPHVENINACGEGHIIRRFVAVDDAGNVSNTCEQHIYVTPVSDWIIHFPPNYHGECGDTITAGMTTTENFGCDLLAVSHKDQYFSVTGDTAACYKIVRTWSVINWCYYDPYAPPVVVLTDEFGAWIDETSYNNYGHYQYQQIIKVHDTTPPTLSFPFDTTFCTLDADCQSGDVSLPIQIDGECSDDFEIVYHLDFNNDLSYDANGTGFYEGPAPIGHHRIVYVVKDACYNESELTVEFSVVDCKKPTPVCISGLIVEIMQTGMIQICASSFNDKSFDNCPGPLTFSFSQDVTDSCRIFTCADTYQNLPIEMWVTDAAGNQAFCTTTLQIQDNIFSCNIGVPIVGMLMTEAHDAVQDASVQLNSVAINPSMMTGNDGMYHFDNVNTGDDYSITPAKDDNYLNGVTTFDLVLISKHILGIQPLTSPYKLIAADANNSHTVTTFDLVALRKLILMIDSNLPNNTSWRFVDKAFQFQNPANPWQPMFPEVINLNNLAGGMNNADFIAVKIGDVNGSAVPNDNFAGGNGDRGAGMLMFMADKSELVAGNTVQVSLKAKDFQDVYGFQFTIDYDMNALQFQGIVPTSMTSPENFGLNLVNEGAITVSWYETVPMTLPDDEAIITLAFLVKSAGQLDGAVGISSRFTHAEAYIGENMEIVDVDISFEDGQVSAAGEAQRAGFELYQNVPNPFVDFTTIGFKLPKASHAIFTILDGQGRVVMNFEGDYPAGYNEIRLQAHQLSAGDGILYYRLETPEFSATQKMTNLK